MRIRAKYVSIKYARTADEAAKDFIAQYDNRTDFENRHQSTVDKLKRSAMLTKEQVGQIIGNTSWTTISCDSCREQNEQLVCFGEYDTKDICIRCLDEAKLLLEGLEVQGSDP